MGHLLRGSMVRLMATSSKKAYAPPITATPRAPAPAAGHCWPILHRRHSNTQRHVWLSLSGVPGVHKILSEPSEHLLWVWGLILNEISPLLPSCWGFSFALGCGVSFSGGIRHSPVDGYSTASCNFEVLAGDECWNWAIANPRGKVSFYSNPKERQCQRMFKIPHSCTHLTR